METIMMVATTVSLAIVAVCATTLMGTGLYLAGRICRVINEIEDMASPGASDSGEEGGAE